MQFSRVIEKFSAAETERRAARFQPLEAGTADDLFLRIFEQTGTQFTIGRKKDKLSEF
jgi:hypothetical protein